jgi:hypothetical protein
MHRFELGGRIAIDCIVVKIDLAVWRCTGTVYQQKPRGLQDEH